MRYQYSSVRDVPQPKNSRVADLAGYGLERSAGLADAISDFEESVDAPVYVVTLPSIGRPKSGVKSFATSLFNEWRIGICGSQKGVLILIVKDVRRVEVEVGTRLNHVVSHSYTTRMLENDVLPELKKGKYGGGVEKAVRRLAARIANVNKPLMVVPDQEILSLLVVGALGVGGAVNAIAKDRRGRTCDACGGVVTQGHVAMSVDLPPSAQLAGLNALDKILYGSAADGVNGNEDDAFGLKHLLPGTTGYKRVGAWETVKHPSYVSSGRRERTLHCHKCGAVSTKVQIIPRLVEYSSSSDGGGCSDGGGGGGGDF